MPKSDTGTQRRNRYQAIIERFFQDHHQRDLMEFEFTRDEFVTVANTLKIDLPKNVGDVVYSFRYRNELPPSIKSTVSKGLEWVIEGAGRAKYRFKQGWLN